MRPHTDQWWALAGVLIDASESAQAECERAVAADNAKRNVQRAQAAGHATVISTEIVSADRAGIARASRAIRRKVAAAGKDGVTWTEVRHSVQHKDRDAYARKARNALEATGELRVEDVSVGDRKGERLWLET